MHQSGIKFKIWHLATIIYALQGIIKLQRGFLIRRKPLQLPAIYIEEADYYVEHGNILPMWATIISKGYATLHELKTVYYYEDALDLYELAIINGYNELKHQEIENLKAQAQSSCKP